MTKSVFTKEYDQFLKLLRDARRKAKLNQREVAERLGETVLYVSRCERGERRMDVIELYRFCDAIDKSAVEFMRELASTIG